MLIDKHSRVLEYLRISVTDRCNLRCGYCMPQHGVEFIPHEEILSYDEIIRIVSIMAELGISKVRLTGGEPTVRKGITGLASQIKSINGIQKLGITTNGTKLEKMANDLFDAGVDWVNISLDTLDKARYKAITHRDELDNVLNGLQSAMRLPFSSVKVNCVMSPSSTDQDFLSVAGLAKSNPIDVRFIEWMPMNGDECEAITADQAIVKLEQYYGTLTPAHHSNGAGPARYYSADGFKGKLGMIPAISHCFCSECNRLRLTSTGDLKLCLFYDTGISLRDMMRSGASDQDISKAIIQCVNSKPKKHSGVPKHSEQDISCISEPVGMSKIGG